MAISVFYVIYPLNNGIKVACKTLYFWIFGEGGVDFLGGLFGLFNTCQWATSIYRKFHYLTQGGPSMERGVNTA